MLAIMWRSATFVPCWWEWKMTYLLWNSLEVPPKIIIRPRNHLFEFMSKGYKARMFQDVSTISYPCHLVHNNQDGDTVQCPWADKSRKCDVYIQWNVIQSLKMKEILSFSAINEVERYS